MHASVTPRLAPKCGILCSWVIETRPLWPFSCAGGPARAEMTGIRSCSISRVGKMPSFILAVQQASPPGCFPSIIPSLVQQCASSCWLQGGVAYCARVSTVHPRQSKAGLGLGWTGILGTLDQALAGWMTGKRDRGRCRGSPASLAPSPVSQMTLCNVNLRRWNCQIIDLTQRSSYSPARLHPRYSPAGG